MGSGVTETPVDVGARWELSFCCSAFWDESKSVWFESARLDTTDYAAAGRFLCVLAGPCVIPTGRRSRLAMHGQHRGARGAPRLRTRSAVQSRNGANPEESRAIGGAANFHKAVRLQTHACIGNRPAHV